MSIICERRFQICAGHRVYEHESKCRHPHGHNYIIWITAQGESKELDNLGRVIDFSVLKEKLGSWLDDNWDHGFLYWKEDHEMQFLFTEYQRSQISKFKTYEMPTNPTAENMAKYLLNEICPKIFKDDGVIITKVKIYETENCVAEANTDTIITVGWK